jgi:hypothetical protein
MVTDLKALFFLVCSILDVTYMSVSTDQLRPTQSLKNQYQAVMWLELEARNLANAKVQSENL